MEKYRDNGVRDGYTPENQRLESENTPFQVKKEKHLETTNFLGSKCYISGVQFSSQQKKWEKLPSKSSWSHQKTSLGAL